MMFAIGMDRPAKVIERLRLARGLTRAEACGAAGLPRATWAGVESGRVLRPRPRTRVRIARALGMAPSAIWPVRPRPLHLEDVDDPRWGAAVRAMAQRLDRQAPLEERRRFGRHLIAVLDHADPGAHQVDAGSDRWDELWRLANSLTIDPENTPIALINGKLVERELDTLTPAARLRVSAANGGRVLEEVTAQR